MPDSIPTDGKYVLTKTGKVRQEKDLLKWAKFMSSGRQRLAYTDFPKHYVSTIFLGLDYGFGEGKPVLWETMAFEKKITRLKTFKDPKTGIEVPQMNFQKSVPDCQNRYYTEKEALAGHKLICEAIKKLQKK